MIAFRNLSNLFGSTTKKNSSEDCLCEFWESTEEMPWDVWRKIYETGNITLVLKSGQTSALNCLMKWYNLQDEYVAKFGHSDEYNDIIKAKQQACLKMIEYLKTGDRFKEFESKIALEELKTLDIKTNIITLNEEKAIIQRASGLRIDKTWTVDEYYYQKNDLIKNG